LDESTTQVTPLRVLQRCISNCGSADEWRRGNKNEGGKRFMGSLRCLNVAGGDIKISFDTNNAGEAIRAKRIITEMMKRGYALLIEGKGGKYQRAKGFDAKVGEYIIADYDPTVEVEEEENEQSTETKTENTHRRNPELRPRDKRVPMEKTKAVAVAPSSGG
jgi:hypothetical protein